MLRFFFLLIGMIATIYDNPPATGDETFSLTLKTDESSYGPDQESVNFPKSGVQLLEPEAG